MLTLLLAFATLPTAYDPLPVAHDVEKTSCKCGDACPKGGCDNCECPTNNRPPKPEGEGWFYDEKNGYWWRYAKAATVAAPSFTADVGVFHLSAPFVSPAAYPAVRFSRSSAAANCSS